MRCILIGECYTYFILCYLGGGGGGLWGFWGGGLFLHINTIFRHIWLDRSKGFLYHSITVG